MSLHHHRPLDGSEPVSFPVQEGEKGQRFLGATMRLERAARDLLFQTKDVDVSPEVREALFELRIGLEATQRARFDLGAERAFPDVGRLTRYREALEGVANVPLTLEGLTLAVAKAKATLARD